MNGEQPPVQPQDELDAQAADAARRVVDGQGVVNNDEYLQHHPNAIQDKDKARYVAYATKRTEEDVVHQANAATRLVELAQASPKEILDTASVAPATSALIESAETEFGTKYSERSPTREPELDNRVRDDITDWAVSYTENARKLRASADSQASRAGTQYDILADTKAMKSGILPPGQPQLEQQPPHGAQPVVEPKEPQLQ